MSSENNEDPVSIALQNQLVRHEIFKFLPMKSLLDWSLTNKAWNTNIRTYFRDYRKCTVSIRPSLSEPLCGRLKGFDDMLAGMTTVVPFNSLQLFLEPEPFEPAGRFMQLLGPSCKSWRTHVHKDGDPADLSCTSLFAKMKLKHLSISCEENPIIRCPIICFLYCVLSGKSSEIKDLKLGKISSYFVALLAEEKLNFPSLEVLRIKDLDGILKHNGLMGKFIDAAPKLTRIIHDGDPRIFRILSQDKCDLLVKLDFSSVKKRFINLGMEIARGPPPALRELTFSVSPRKVKPEALENYNRMCQTLLKSCYGSLETLDVTGVQLIEKVMATFLDLPPFKKLSALGLRDDDGDLLPLIQRIDFPRLFPKLTKVELTIFSPEVMPQENHPPAPGAGDNLEDQVFSSDLPNRAKTVSSLFISADFTRLNLRNVEGTFPEVTQLAVFPFLDRDDHTVVPYSKIFKHWPNLKTLDVRDGFGCHVSNYDAEFCGINQEEAELLGTMDNEDLRRLHIVPVRPCVSTMPNLRCLNQLRHSDSRLVRNDRHHRVFTEVTEFLVFERMPWLSVHHE